MNKISLKFVSNGTINNIPALVQIMAWRRPGDIMNQWCLVYWHIYASPDPNEITYLLDYWCANRCYPVMSGDHSAVMLLYCLRVNTVHCKNYANPIYGVATICHQVRWLRWGASESRSFSHVSFNLIWNVMRERYIIQTYMDGIYKHVFCVCTIWDAQSF